jgi:hypothetical protein
MVELLSHLADAPLANILVLAGLAFLGIGVIGKISGKLEPSAAGRVMCGVLGTVLLVFGIYAHATVDTARAQSKQPPEGQTTHTHQVTEAPHSSDICIQGFVWREAFSGDHVCVIPAIRAQAAADNRMAASRRSPNGGPYGPDACSEGFVWREAGPRDHVCVPPSTREQAKEDNNAASSRRAKP